MVRAGVPFCGQGRGPLLWSGQGSLVVVSASCLCKVTRGEVNQGVKRQQPTRDNGKNEGKQMEQGTSSGRYYMLATDFSTYLQKYKTVSQVCCCPLATVFDTHMVAEGRGLEAYGSAQLSFLMMWVSVGVGGEGVGGSIAVHSCPS